MKKLLVISMSALALASCVKEQINSVTVEEAEGGNVTLSAERLGAETKTTFDGRTTFWQATDKLGVFTFKLTSEADVDPVSGQDIERVLDVTNDNVEFSTSALYDGRTSATFTGELSRFGNQNAQENIYAIYPRINGAQILDFDVKFDTSSDAYVTEQKGLIEASDADNDGENDTWKYAGETYESQGDAEAAATAEGGELYNTDKEFYDNHKAVKCDQYDFWYVNPSITGEDYSDKSYGKNAVAWFKSKETYYLSTNNVNLGAPELEPHPISAALGMTLITANSQFLTLKTLKLTSLNTDGEVFDGFGKALEVSLYDEKFEVIAHMPTLTINFGEGKTVPISGTTARTVIAIFPTEVISGFNVEATVVNPANTDEEHTIEFTHTLNNARSYSPENPVGAITLTIPALDDDANASDADDIEHQIAAGKTNITATLSGQEEKTVTIPAGKQEKETVTLNADFTGGDVTFKVEDGSKVKKIILNNTTTNTPAKVIIETEGIDWEIRSTSETASTTIMTANDVVMKGDGPVEVAFSANLNTLRLYRANNDDNNYQQGLKAIYVLDNEIASNDDRVTAIVQAAIALEGTVEVVSLPDEITTTLDDASKATFVTMNDEVVPDFLAASWKKKTWKLNKDYNLKEMGITSIFNETTILGDPEEEFVLTAPANLPEVVLNLENLTVRGSINTSVDLNAKNVTFENNITLNEGNTTFTVDGGIIKGDILPKKANATANIKNATLEGKIDGTTSDDTGKGVIKLNTVTADELTVKNTRKVEVENVTIATNLTVDAKDNIKIYNTKVNGALNAYSTKDIKVENSLITNEKGGAKNFSHLKANLDVTLTNTTFSNDKCPYLYLVAGNDLNISGSASDNENEFASIQSDIEGIVYMNAAKKINAESTLFGDFTYVNVTSSTAGDKTWLSEYSITPNPEADASFKNCEIDVQVATRSKTTFDECNFAHEGEGTGSKANGIRVLATDADKNEEDEVTTYDWIIVNNCTYGSDEVAVIVNNFKTAVWPFTINVDGINKASVIVNGGVPATIAYLQNEW